MGKLLNCATKQGYVVLAIQTDSHRNRRNSSLTLNIIYCRWNTDQHFSLTPSAPAGSELKVFTVSCPDAPVLSVLISLARSFTHNTLKHELIHLINHSNSQSIIQEDWKCDNQVASCQSNNVKGWWRLKLKTDPKMYNTVR